MNREDKRLEDALAESAAKLDSVDAPTPDFAFFKDIVATQQAKLRRAQKRQLALFIVVAAVLVSAIILCMGQFQTFFIALQGAALAGAAAVLGVFIARTRRAEAGLR